MDKISAHKVASVIVMARELDRSEPQLRSYVSDMDEEEQAALVAVMWIGRGAFEADEWGDAYETAYAEASTPTGDYLIGTPHLADHLEAGLEALGYDVAAEEEAVMGRG